MKAVLKLLLFPFALIVLFAQCEKEPEPVNITDDAFLAALIERGVDTNGDGAISFEEAEQLNILNVSYRDIHSLEGIDAFVNLKILYCHNNQLTSLDISNNTYLWSLDISYMPTLNEVCVWTKTFSSRRS